MDWTYLNVYEILRRMLGRASKDLGPDFLTSEAPRWNGCGFISCFFVFAFHFSRCNTFTNKILI